MAASAEDKATPKTDKRDKPDKPEPSDELSITRHRARIGKREFGYTATCGTIVLKE